MKPKTSALKQSVKPAAKASAAKASAAKAAKPTDDPSTFLAALAHPLKADIEAVRRAILGASPAITEGIKWNSPSFRTTEFFATVHLRATDQVQLVYHLGAKARPDLKAMSVADPSGLIKWLGKDRGLVSLGAGDGLRKNLPALAAITREWIRYV